jgi:hypothetical protein
MKIYTKYDLEKTNDLDVSWSLINTINDVKQMLVGVCV